MYFLNRDFLKILLILCCSSLWVVVAISPQIQTSVFKGVPDNWASSFDSDPFVKIGQKYYYIDTKQQVDWYTAVHDCRRRNANLASIETAAEFDDLNEYLLKNNINHWFWISGNDLAKEGEYYWMGTGNPISYARWDTNQPDNDKGIENCINLWKQKDQFFLNDWACTGRTRFICEAKTPTTIALTVW